MVELTEHMQRALAMHKVARAESIDIGSVKVISYLADIPRRVDLYRNKTQIHEYLFHDQATIAKVMTSFRCDPKQPETIEPLINSLMISGEVYLDWVALQDNAASGASELELVSACYGHLQGFKNTLHKPEEAFIYGLIAIRPAKCADLLGSFYRHLDEGNICIGQRDVDIFSQVSASGQYR